MTEAKNSIYHALALAQAQVTAAGKSGENMYDRYKYAMLSDYCEVIRKPMADNGLALSVSIQHVERLLPRKTKSGSEEQVVQVTILGTLFHKDGECLSFTCVGEGQDRSDKAIYKAITGAKKYLLSNIFNVPTTDDPEKDSDHERDGKPTETKKTPPPATKPAQPAAAVTPPAAVKPAAQPAAQPPAQPKPNPIMSDEERAKHGYISKAQYDRITDKLVQNRITSLKWRTWLRSTYSCESATHIQLDQFDGIMEQIAENPDAIINFVPKA